VDDLVADLPHHSVKLEVERIRGGDPRAAPRLVDPLPVEPLKRNEPLVGLARQDQIGFEFDQDLDRAVEQRVAKPQLGEHQDHGEPDPRYRDRQTPPVVREVVPRQRCSWARERHRAAGVRDRG
jgi:hypothetical protein